MRSSEVECGYRGAEEIILASGFEYNEGMFLSPNIGQGKIDSITRYVDAPSELLPFSVSSRCTYFFSQPRDM